MDFTGMFELVLVNFEIIAIWFVFFCLTVVANIIAKTFYNVHNAGQVFEAKRFLSGFVKMLAIGVSSALLGLVASAIPEALRVMPILEISDELTNAASILVIIAVFANATLKYFKSAIESIKDVVDGFNYSPDDSER